MRVNIHKRLCSSFLTVVKSLRNHLWTLQPCQWESKRFSWRRRMPSNLSPLQAWASPWLASGKWCWWGQKQLYFYVGFLGAEICATLVRKFAPKRRGKHSPKRRGKPRPNLWWMLDLVILIRAFYRLILGESVEGVFPTFICRFSWLPVEGFQLPIQKMKTPHVRTDGKQGWRDFLFLTFTFRWLETKPPLTVVQCWFTFFDSSFPTKILNLCLQINLQHLTCRCFKKNPKVPSTQVLRDKLEPRVNSKDLTFEYPDFTKWE